MNFLSLATYKIEGREKAYLTRLWHLKEIVMHKSLDQVSSFPDPGMILFHFLCWSTESYVGHALETKLSPMTLTHFQGSFLLLSLHLRLNTSPSNSFLLGYRMSFLNNSLALTNTSLPRQRPVEGGFRASRHQKPACVGKCHLSPDGLSLVGPRCQSVHSVETPQTQTSPLGFSSKIKRLSRKRKYFFLSQRKMES